MLTIWRKLPVWLPVATLTLGLANTAAGANHCVILNNNPVEHHGNNLHQAHRGAQSFLSPVAQAAGCNLQITFRVCKTGNPPGGLVFELFNGDIASNPAATQIGSTTIAESAILATCVGGNPGLPAYGNVSAVFDLSSAVAVGQALSVRVRQAGDLGAGNQNYQLGLTNNQGYPNGRYCTSGDGGTSWTCPSTPNSTQPSDRDAAHLEVCALACQPPPTCDVCTRTQGYWKTHALWPVTSLTIGGQTYTQAELQQILDTPVRGNGAISLAHQLIAAKLNVANGACDGDIAATITASDTLISSTCGLNKIPPIGSCSIAPSAASPLVSILAQYNEGFIGPGHCP